MNISEQYLNYSEFLTMGGTLSQSAFVLLEYEARLTVDMFTSSRLVGLQEQPTAVKLCVNALIKKIQEYNEASAKSESSDGYSISYNKPTSREERKERYDIVKTYLATLEVNGENVLCVW